MSGDLEVALARLARTRPVFHSEADFQHALAWQLQLMDQTAQLRLEYRPFPEERFYVDIWLTSAGERLAIEVKYLTRALDEFVRGERFVLKNQAAQDISRHDVVKDIVRLERVAHELPSTRGALVALTNDTGYWNRSTRAGTVDAAFRLHDGRKLSGTLAWASSAGKGTTAKREIPLALKGTYELTWRNYSRLGSGPGREFRYLLVAVEREP